jgi:hypothetical protein
VNNVVSIRSLSNQRVSCLSAFDLEPTAALGLGILWNSSSTWKTKAQQLHGAWMLLSTPNSLGPEIQFLIEICWIRHNMEFNP